MYIASTDERKYPKNAQDSLDRERREFIREAAIRLCVQHRSRDSIWLMSTADTKEVWDAASKLWSERPEDC